MSRVISYIGGFNLYFGLENKGWKRYYWLDLPGLCARFLRPEQQLERTHYFTPRSPHAVPAGETAFEVGETDRSSVGLELRSWAP